MPPKRVATSIRGGLGGLVATELDGRALANLAPMSRGMPGRALPSGAAPGPELASLYFVPQDL